METKNKSVTIRRFVAVGLMLLSILMLFWPSVIRINGESDAWGSLTEQMRESGKRQYGFRYANDWRSHQERYSDRRVSESDYREAVEVGRESYDFLLDDSYNASFFRLRSFLPKLIKYSPDSDAQVISVVISAVLNTLFFTILLFALASIPMMLFNKSKVFNILHVVFTFLTASVLLLAGLTGLIAKNIPDTGIEVSPINPGIATFLLPAFSLAALIVYKRVRVKKAAPVSQQPVYAQPPVSQQPVYAQPSTPQPVEDAPRNLWTCTTCGAKNVASARFCETCGAENVPPKAPENGPWTCPVCGAENVASARFCEMCGTKRV